MSESHLLVVDLDSTLRKNGPTGEGQHTVKPLARHRRKNVTLVYATSQSFPCAWRLVEAGMLPQPAAVAASVGTEVWFPEWTGPDPSYREFVCHNWNRDMVISFAKRLSGLVLQEESFQAPFKVRFQIQKKLKLFDVQQLLLRGGIDVRVAYSSDGYLDVVPRYAGKQKAIEFLGYYFRVEPRNVLRWMALPIWT